MWKWLGTILFVVMLAAVGGCVALLLLDAMVVP